MADCKKQRGVNCTKALDIAMEDCSNMDVLYDSSDTSDEEVIAKPSCKNPKAVEESEGAKAKRESEEAKGKISFATETLRVTEGSQQLLDIIAHFVKQLHQPKQTTVQTFSSHADLMDNLGVPVEDGENPMPVMFSFINFLGDPHVQQFVRLAGFPNEELDKICHVIENEMSTNLPAAMQLNDIVTTILKNYRGTVGNDNNAVQNLRSLLESLRQQAERDKLKWEALVLPGWLQLRQASFDSWFRLQVIEYAIDALLAREYNSGEAAYLIEPVPFVQFVFRRRWESVYFKGTSKDARGNTTEETNTQNEHWQEVEKRIKEVQNRLQLQGVSTSERLLEMLTFFVTELINAISTVIARERDVAKETRKDYRNFTTNVETARARGQVDRLLQENLALRNENNILKGSFASQAARFDDKQEEVDRKQKEVDELLRKVQILEAQVRVTQPQQQVPWGFDEFAPLFKKSKK